MFDNPAAAVFGSLLTERPERNIQDVHQALGADRARICLHRRGPCHTAAEQEPVGNKFRRTQLERDSTRSADMGPDQNILRGDRCNHSPHPFVVACVE